MRGIIIRKGAALLTVIILLLSVAVPAFANEQVTATVALNLRSGPGTNYPIVGELKKGETATRIGTTGNWSIILMGGSKLYASSTYLTTGSAGGSSSESVMYTSIKLNVRSGPGTSFKVISQLEKGSAVSVLGTVGSWSIIRWNDSTAYVFTSYLTGTGSSGSSSSGGTVMTATSNVNVRSGPGTSYKVVGVLLAGQNVTRTGTSGSWTKVNYNGATAYIHSAYLKAAGGSSSSGASYEATTAMNVRSGPGSSYSIIGSLAKGQRVTSKGTVGNWTQIDFKSTTGYVITGYLAPVSASSVSPASGMMRATSSSTVRSGAGSNYNSMGTLSSGTLVALTGYSGSWAQIDFNGRTGYVPSNTLTDAYNFNVSYASGEFVVDYRVSAHDGPGTAYPEVFLFRGGEIVRRTGTSGSWARVVYGNQSMFLPSSAISRLESFMGANKVMFTAYSGVPYYSEPISSNWYYYSVLGAKDEPVTVTGVGSSWVSILRGSRTYYVMLRDLYEYPGGKHKKGDALLKGGTGSVAIFSDKEATIQHNLSSASQSSDSLSFIEAVSADVVSAMFKANGSTTEALVYARIADIDSQS